MPLTSDQPLPDYQHERLSVAFDKVFSFMRKLEYPDHGPGYIETEDVGPNAQAI